MVQILPSPRPDPFAFATRDAIKSIVDSIGKAETKRQQILLNNKVMSIVAAGGDPEQITRDIAQAVISQDPQFDPGIAGFFQRVGSRFAQPVGQEFAAPLAKQALGQPTGLEREQKAATLELTKARTVATKRGRRAKAEKTAIFKSAELKNVRGTIDASVNTLAKTPISGRNAITQDSFLDNYKQKAAEVGYSDLSTAQQKQFDSLYDARARRQSTRFGTATANDTGATVKLGWNPNSVEVKAARKELKNQPSLKQTDIDLQLQTPPDARLDEFWPNLPDEEKLEIIEKLNDSPANIGPILQILRAG